ncbi:MAG TPA: twin-arginine translocase TatA/TatE family subunit [Gaiellales bacterium]|jgi:sec-independent protein translocase protein TatA|nr:twin-arginine translocase TatA/TatE family subunit [Gaiellales bacterium]
MFEPSWEKLLIVLVIALIVLGPKKLPEVGRSLGRGIREFKDGVTGKEEEHHPQPPAAAIQPPPASPAYTPPAAEPAHTAPASGDQVSTHSE